MANLPVPPPKFEARKKEILDQLSVPTTEYTDASPKGSVDEGIRNLIAEINGYAGFVTTSSCAGRVSVFLEGRKKGAVARADGLDAEVDAAEESPSDGARLASTGGKGGGSWLFVSHDPIDAWAETSKGDFSWTSFLGLGPGEEAAPNVAGLEEAERLVHFKFEPMILHILTASNEHAQLVLRCALEAGFRESGALNISEKTAAGADGPTPMVAVRSMGLLFESLVGSERDGKRTCMVSEAYLWRLVSIANERFVENQKRIERFRNALEKATSGKLEGEQWEPKEARLARKRAEGLRRQEEARKEKEKQPADEPRDDAGLYESLQSPENE
ncbi:hypothetical protein GQ53DRAFT_727452 [Thozetella sp. PMI_491]|nr:hypothetical protein GQ53DRAFT_727452 [Thozetella sp. PMI_491]